MNDLSATASMKRVLITGAAGAIGSVLRRGLRSRYGLLRLADSRPVDAAAAGEETVRGDVTDMETALAMTRGIDCLVHLAGIPQEDSWENILQANIVGTYTVFEAAYRNGVKRVIYASSNHVIGFHRAERELDTAAPLRPDSRYGVSKVFGEALGRLYADKFGMDVFCLRIGSFRPAPEDRRQLATWLSPDDAVRLVTACIEAPGRGFVVAYGVSANRRRRWINEGLDFLGYVPRDDAELHAARLESREEPRDPVAAAFHGGSFCSAEFDGDPDRID